MGKDRISSWSPFGTNLARLREESGISRKELAAAAGVSLTSIGYYETGKSDAPLATLVKIASALHVSIDALLGYHLDEYERAAAIWRKAGFSIIKRENDTVYITDDSSNKAFTISTNDLATPIKLFFDTSQEYRQLLHKELLDSLEIAEDEEIEEIISDIAYLYGIPENAPNRITEIRKAMSRKDIQTAITESDKRLFNSFHSMAKGKAKLISYDTFKMLLNGEYDEYNKNRLRDMGLNKSAQNKNAHGKDTEDARPDKSKDS